MPLATRLPRKGGAKRGLSVSTSGLRSGSPAGAGSSSRKRRGTFLVEISRPKLGVVAVAAADLAEAVEDAQALEGVLAVEEPALVDRSQVALDVGARQRGAAQQDVDVGHLALVHDLEVLAHDQGGLDEQAAHAQGVGVVLFDGAEHLVDSDLDAEVDDLVAVVGQDDVHQVLADVVDVALDRGEHDAAPSSLVALFHPRLEVGHGRLHGLGALQDEGELHLAAREEVAHHAHPVEQDVVNDVEGLRRPRPSPRPGRPSSPTRAPSMMRRRSRSLSGSPSRSPTPEDARVDALEEPQQLGERVVALGAPVVDEVQADLAGLARRCGAGAGSWRRARWRRRDRPRRTRGERRC